MQIKALPDWSCWSCCANICKRWKNRNFEEGKKSDEERDQVVDHVRKFGKTLQFIDLRTSACLGNNYRKKMWEEVLGMVSILNDKVRGPEIKKTLHIWEVIAVLYIKLYKIVLYATLLIVCMKHHCLRCYRSKQTGEFEGVVLMSSFTISAYRKEQMVESMKKEACGKDWTFPEFYRSSQL